MTKEERAEYMKKYRDENREQINANKRYWYKQNRERLVKKQREQYRAKKGEEYVKTIYDRIKAMTIDEMVDFFAHLEKDGIITTADRYICRKCKAEHEGHCPINDNDNCLYDLSNKETIRLWLEGGAE